ncbi:MAG: hypothetical protein KDD15_08520 [Lewinella sp.]|nr:hypothetical protein [Lewinella sp.]
MCHSQEEFTISNLTKVPQASYAHPALVPHHLRYFIGVPAISGLQLHGNSQGFTLKDIGLTNLLDPDFNYEMARQMVSKDNTYRFGVRTDLLYGGIANKSGVFTINFTERILGETILPRDLFGALADEEMGTMYQEGYYDLSSFSTQALHFKELGVAYTTQKRKGVNWGVRLKFLLGHEAIFSENKELMLYSGGESDYQNFSSMGKLFLRSAGFQHFSPEDQLFRLFSVKNAGVALDAGFHYRYNKRWEFFGSVRDLGGITWRKSLNLREVSGEIPDLESEISDTFDDLVNERPETTKSFRTALPVQFSGGMRYFLKNDHRINALASVRMYPSGADLGLSAGYYIPVTSWLEWTGTYSIYNKQFFNLGTGFAMQFGKIQLYFASDNVVSAFSALGSNNANFQAGVNLTWNKPEKKNKKPTANRETIKPEDPAIASSNSSAGEHTEEEEDMPYFTLNSHFTTQAEGREVKAIYVDIYRYDDKGEKQLIHTSRYPSDEFEVTLYRIHSLHELSVKAYGFEPLVYQFVPDTDGLSREFKLVPENNETGE